MKLIGSDASPFARKVRIVLAEKKIEYEFEAEDPWGEKSGIWANNPLGQVPVLLLEDGTPIFDSRVIVEFLDNASPLAKLITAPNRERTEVKRWEALADGVLDAGVLLRMERQRKPSEQSAEWMTRQQRKIEAGLQMMARDLGGNAWCAGNAYSLADICVGSCLGWLAFRFPEIRWQDELANLARHFAKLGERSSFAETTPQG